MTVVVDSSVVAALVDDGSHGAWATSGLAAFAPVADRVWELHPTVTSYDAAFVALAEGLDVPLWTLDRRLSRASGPRCLFVVPPS